MQLQICKCAEASEINYFRGYTSMCTTLTLLGKRDPNKSIHVWRKAILRNIFVQVMFERRKKRDKKEGYLVQSSATEKEMCIDLIDWYNLILKNLVVVFVTCFIQAVLCHNPYCHHITETQEIPFLLNFVLLSLLRVKGVCYRRILLFFQFQFSTGALFSQICSLCRPFRIFVKLNIML